jgi:hypothetical protein
MNVTNENILGLNAVRIETEYLERLNKTRFGLDAGWRPPGLMLKGGSARHRRQALQRLHELAELDGFWCSYVALGPDLSLANTHGVCETAIEAAGLSAHFEPEWDAHCILKRLAASARQFERNGWVLLIDNVDRFPGTIRSRAESYQEVARWMGSPTQEPVAGLFCVLAVTPEFEAAVETDMAALPAIRAELRSTGASEDLLLLEGAEAGIAALEHEALVRELLVLE